MNQNVLLTIQTILGLAFIFFAIKYYKWLYKKGIDNFRKWLEKKIGYSIDIIPGYRNISWKVDSNAPLKIKIFIGIVHPIAMLIINVLPIILLAGLGILSLVLEKSA